MSLNTQQQIQGLLKQKGNILIALPKDPSIDAISSGLALAMVLEKNQQKIKIVAADFNLMPHHGFLAKSKDIEKNLSALRKFIITLNTARTQAEELSYDLDKEQLNIYITPKNGFFEPKDVTTSAGAFAYDLIFVIDSPDLESLGPIYEQNAEFFYHTPIINIDHKAANEQFGQVNLVETTATSTSEIIFELIQELDNKKLDEYMATNLLAGIISKTKSFKSSAVTPRSLAIASHLITSGARREEIIRHLYQSKPISTLKLWGRALARLKTEPQQKIVWSLLSQEDFQKTQAQESELENVIDELIINTPDAKTVFILYEPEPRTTKCLVSTPTNLDALQLFKEYKPKGSADFTRFTLPGKNIEQAEQIILERLKK